MKAPKQRIITFDKYNYNDFPLDVVLSLSPIDGYLYTYIFNFKRQGIDKLLLSSKHLMETSGISKQAYYSSFNSLVSQGYLLDCEKGYYLFCPNKYSITDKEWLDIVKSYIYNQYYNIKSTFLDLPDEPELDIFPEYDDIKEDLVSSGITDINEFLDMLKGDDSDDKRD